jgi:hypothetical protein
MVAQTQIWTPSVGCPDESTLNLLAKQILNGEVMRTTDVIEPKMVVLQEEGIQMHSSVVPGTWLALLRAPDENSHNIYYQ